MILKYNEWLKEQAIAVQGDWNFDDAHIGELSYFMYTKYWDIKGTMTVEGTEFDIIKHRSANTWRVGKILENDAGEKIFESVMFLEMENSKNIGHKIRISPLYRAKMVGVHSSIRGAGIAKKLYKFLIKNQGYNIIGDTEQFFGARKLWASLSKDSDTVVDIVDTKLGDYIEQNVTLHHGTDDWDFDKRVWDYSDRLKDIRLVLKDII